jgi:hypothetical protein
MLRVLIIMVQTKLSKAARRRKSVTDITVSRLWGAFQDRQRNSQSY